VLKELTKSHRNLPFRLFVIDSAFTNEQDKWNKRDIANFLGQLPHILTDYQIIISMAELEINETLFRDNYRFELFE
jgi:hypothetical protein